MKAILIFILLLPINLYSERKWVQKHYIEYDAITTFQTVDSTNCYAFTENLAHTIIYKSSDQGDTWYKHYDYDHLSIKDSCYEVFKCFALDNDHIYISYRNRALIEKSNDGGKTFKRITFGNISANKYDKPLDFKMFNSNIGTCLLNNHLIITKDNWITFDSIPLGDYKRAGYPIFFVDSNNIAMISWFRNDHEFVKYNILHNEWEQYNVPEKPNNGEYHKALFEVFFVNDTLGYACGAQDTGEANYARDIIWKTIDKGKHWEIVLNTMHEPEFGLTDISFKNEFHGIAIGSWGKIVETFDGGKTWKYLEVPEGLQNSLGYKITWAGKFALITCNRSGIWRLEGEISDVEVLKSDKIKIRQTVDNLLISIEDENFRKYKLQIVDLYGNLIQEEELRSGIGTLFMPVQLNERISGSYFYRILLDSEMVKSGKFVIAN
jgi:hypothetical protein